MLGNIIKKELKELLTLPTLILTISIAFMYAIIGQSIGKAVHETPQKVNIGIVNLDGGSFGELVEHVLKKYANVIYIGKSEEEGLRMLKEKSGVALIAIPEGFTQNILSGRQGELEIVWIMRGTGIADLISTGKVQGVLGMINSEIAKKLMERYGVKDPEIVLNPFTQKASTILKERRFNLSPAQIGEKMSSQTTLTSIVIMMLILGAGGSVISS
ncbi:MAG: ABC transporter permease, partial [Thermotogaceae bacterium]|nr:ABC transporter permease [Thermotogaceae bacterium]